MFAEILPLAVSPQSSETVVTLRSEGQNMVAELPWTAEMGHVFNVFSDTNTLDTMVADTVSFFEEHDD